MQGVEFPIFSSRSLYVVVRPPVVCLSSVTFVHPTQAIEIFGNVPTPFGTSVGGGGLNQRGVEKMLRFRSVTRLYLENGAR